MTVSKCPACNREMTSILPVQDGMTTVCCACLVVLVMEAGKLRTATEEEAADKAPQRQPDAILVSGGLVVLCTCSAATRAQSPLASIRESVKQ